jgi:arginase
MIQFLSLNFQNGQKILGLDESACQLKKYLCQYPLLKNELIDCGKIEYYDDLENKSEKHHLLTSSHKVQNYMGQALLKIQSILEGNPDDLLLNWGGDHSIGIATSLAFANTFPKGKILWIDAHADINTPEQSLSGNLHGMPLSISLDIGSESFIKNLPIHVPLRTDQIIYLGLRDLDPFEKELLKDLKIKHFSMDSIRELGIDQVLSHIDQLLGSSPLHVSFDVDSVDPSLVPSTGVRSPGGLTERDLLEISSFLGTRADLKMLDIVELNPKIGSLHEVQLSYHTVLQFLESIYSYQIFKGPKHQPFSRGEFYDRIG